MSDMFLAMLLLLCVCDLYHKDRNDPITAYHEAAKKKKKRFLGKGSLYQPFSDRSS